LNLPSPNKKYPRIKTGNITLLYEDLCPFMQQSGDTPILREVFQCLANREITTQDIDDFWVNYILMRPILGIYFNDFPFFLDNPIVNIVDNALSSYKLPDHFHAFKAFYDKWSDIWGKGLTKEQELTWLHESFMEMARVAFSKRVSQKGEVFTPIELVDFMIRSIKELIKREFNRELWEEGLPILDPFTGLGIFPVRVIQLGIIDSNILYKYQNELFSHEISPFSYIIANLNIERAFYNHTKGKFGYVEYRGLKLYDTFQEFENQAILKEEGGLNVST
jgi:predicted helicase